MLEAGYFVRVQNAPEKIGKCVAARTHTVDVEWFHSPLRQETQTLSRAEVHAYYPPKHSRCFYYDESANCWETGRILQLINPIVVLVRFPNGKDAELSINEVFMRCHATDVDPFELMNGRIWESPIFHAKRVPLVEELVRQRAATHGLSALLSSHVTLFDHQLGVVRRVLEDPTQRYLLADEVGLGKTVEAAAILRQTLLDRPSSQVLIVVPAHLLSQWQTELRNKTQITSPPYHVHFVSHDDLRTATGKTIADRAWDFVILDEAHHIARHAFNTTDQSQNVVWQRIREVCHTTPRVLLLSATPALHNENDFLAMLHLLEKETYSLTDREPFQNKIASRAGVAVALDLVQEHLTTPLELKEAADALREYLSTDPWIINKAESLEALRRRMREDRQSVTEQEIKEVVRETRLHICETHRVHRRMLRSSRQRIPKGILPDQAAGKVTPEWLSGSRCEAVQSGLEDWRELAVVTGSTDKDYQRVFHIFLSLSSSWIPLLMEGIRLRLGTIKLPNLVPTSAAEVLMETDCFHDEEIVLGNWLREMERAEKSDDEDDSLASLGTLLAHHRSGKRVIFTAYTSVAKEIQRRLMQSMQPRYIYLHVATMDVLERQGALNRFREESASAVMICDGSGEEGLNLQFADRVIFFDIPWEPNRLEQRVGRVNRIGGPKNMVPINVLLQETERCSFSEAFYTLLREGIKLFSTSVADLQFFLDGAVPEWVETALNEGADKLKNKVPTIWAAVLKERQSLRQQSDIDTLEAYSVDNSNFEKSIRDADEDIKQKWFQESLKGWLCSALRLGYYGTPVRFRHTDDTLLPLDIWEGIAKNLEVQEHMAFMRSDLERYSSAALMRAGHPFVDAIAAYTQWEDRGRAWAMWRTLAPGVLPEINTETFFRFDLICEVDLEPLRRAVPELNEVDLRALARRAAGWFPPVFQSVCVDAMTAESITDPGLYKCLIAVYDKYRGDINLSKATRRNIVDSIVPDYQEKLHKAWTNVRYTVKTATTTTQSQEVAKRKASKVWQIHENQLIRGIASTEKVSLHDRKLAVIAEQSIHNALLAGIENPLVHLDAVGLIVLSRSNPVFDLTDEKA